MDVIKTEAHLVKDNFNKKKSGKSCGGASIQRTCYNIGFETSKLIKSAIDALDKHLNVTEISVEWRVAAWKASVTAKLEAGAAMMPLQ